MSSATAGEQVKKPSEAQLEQALVRLREALPQDQLLVGEAVGLAYGTDNSRMLHPPFAVALPANEQQVADVVRIACETGVPVMPRGRGTSSTGSSLAECGGFALATDRLNAIVAVNPANRTATVQPGVLNRDLQEQAGTAGLFWPPDPGSAAYCSVGGNLATAAAGPRGIKYGGVRENVLGLRAVTAAGEIVSCGSQAAKCAAGYDLTRLIVGSEGTLAVITEATLRLVPLPAASCGTLACFASDEQALDAVGALLQLPATPAALEFIDRACASLLHDAGLPPQAQGVLLVQHDAGSSASAKGSAAAAVQLLRAQDGCLQAEERAPAELLEAREVLSQRLRELAPVKINEDVAVPVDRLADLLREARTVAADAGARCAVFGHAGAGNLHINLLLDEDSEQSRSSAETALERIFGFAVGCGGAISGEHGIGIAKRRFMRLQADAPTLKLMRAIKQAFDPAGVLNPGKILPEGD